MWLVKWSAGFLEPLMNANGMQGSEPRTRSRVREHVGLVGRYLAIHHRLTPSATMRSDACYGHVPYVRRMSFRAVHSPSIMTMRRMNQSGVFHSA